ncbi:response regulator [Salegentibacter sp. LM13S]|uniref:response regulator n=1 Tax=Salegentibacter lacus TaxID=2873599 RepID=UPI001CCC8C68|nr:response regulator [Salegentibacter lacus]MBZ9631267.1 response regulator [Salegentibacter lacus]
MFPKQNIHILAIDDDPVNLFLIEKLVKKICPDAKFLSSRNGEDGINQFKNNKVDLVFLDIQLPTIDGYQTAREIRQNNTTTGQRTPIIALSGYAEEELKMNGDAQSMDYYLRKPIKIQSMEHIFTKFLTEEIKECCQ